MMQATILAGEGFSLTEDHTGAYSVSHAATEEHAGFARPLDTDLERENDE